MTLLLFPSINCKKQQSFSTKCNREEEAMSQIRALSSILKKTKSGFISNLKRNASSRVFSSSSSSFSSTVGKSSIFGFQLAPKGNHVGYFRNLSTAASIGAESKEGLRILVNGGPRAQKMGGSGFSVQPRGFSVWWFWHRMEDRDDGGGVLFSSAGFCGSRRRNLGGLRMQRWRLPSKSGNSCPSGFDTDRNLGFQNPDFDWVKRRKEEGLRILGFGLIELCFSLMV